MINSSNELKEIYMATVVEHYEKHLAAYYSWLFGDFSAAVESNRQFFILHKLLPGKSNIAIDLGAGCGFGSIALAKLGFKVLAFDLSQTLLDELKSKSGNLEITPIKDNILNFTAHCPEGVELCVCMGDTLTHLESFDDARHLFADVYNSVRTGGKFVLVFRDYIFELKDTDRFIPVKSDSNTIFTCFIEYFEGYVLVNDIVYSRTPQGWKLDVSSYKKLRIPADWVRRELIELGFTITFFTKDKGMITLIACKNN
ncbi:MAG: class I SAM-dependent methyltransferase [Candidatus Methanoperedens sp.]|nr:class I SAM-dependent methyltransferase [Candidatus Methanoperedens sp.]